MTISKIQKYYRILAAITLVLSIATALFSNNRELSERIFIVIAVNLMFHIVFQVLSRMPVAFCQLIEASNSPIKGFATSMIKAFTVITMVVAILGSIGFLYSIFTEQAFERLVMVTVFVAFFLGGFNSKLKLSKNTNA